MKWVALTALLGLSAVTATLAQAPADRAPARPQPAAGAIPATAPASTNAALVSQYCVTCHNERGKAGDLSLAGFDPDRATEHAATAEKMIRKLRAGMMPPPGARRPSADALVALAGTMESKLDAASTANPDPGWRPFQRLNRAEYAREVKRLLSLDVDVSAFLPADTVSNGFDNIADSQSFSPTLMEGYLRAASRITMLAIGDPESSASQATYKVSKATSQLSRVDGAPFGTRGGVSVMHTFPADGDYLFSADFYAEPLGLLFGSTAAGEQLEVSIDGARVALFDINPRMSEEKTGLQVKSAPVHVQAGPRRVTAAFINRSEGLVNDLIAPIDHTLADTEIGIAFGITTLPHLRGLNILGPQQTSGVSDTISRRAVFTCRPTSAADETGCASAIVRRLATDAFRRPVSAHDFDSLMGFFERGRKNASFERGVGKALEAILASPQFLFKLEEPPVPVSPTIRRAASKIETYRLADLPLASRLSFFLWGSGPDAELQKIAGEDRLSAPMMLSRQVKRMLADDRSEALATRFASQWLRLQDLDQVLPDPIQFPYFDQTLAQAFKRETELFVESLVREDRSVLELLTADYTFVNERLARHYGIPDISGNQFQRVKLPEYRRGVLGQGSVLTLTSIATRTSPVMRGKWVLEVLMGSPPPPPPPNVPPLDETKGASGTRLLTVRERMEEHRKNPSCTSCHRVIDPVGLALENFDVTGKWRMKDGDVAVDASGTLYDGMTMSGPAGLREALLKHKDMFLTSFTENLMTYALGRRLEAYDMPAVRRIIRDAARQDYRIGAFINGVVNSVAFQSSRVPPAETSTTTAGSR
jgi:mono/diheme cytochrome c family protein